MAFRLEFLALLILLLVPHIGVAEETLPDISNMSEDELDKLPQETIERLPMKEVMAKYFGDELIIDYMVSLLLSRLMYFAPYSESETKEAIKRFQADLGNAVTGELTVGQFNELHRRFNRSSENPIYVPGTGDELFIGMIDNYLSVEGTWIIENDKIAFPINLSKIECHKHTKICKNNQVDVATPNFESDNDSSQIVLSVYRYEIISWSNTEVVAQSKTDCRTSILTINNSSKEVFEVTRINNAKGCDLGLVTIPALDKPRISRMLPGWKISYNFWQDRKKAASMFLNSEVRSLVESFNKQMKQ